MTAIELRQEYDAYLRDKKSEAVNFSDYVVSVVIPRERAAAVDGAMRELTATYISNTVHQADQHEDEAAIKRGPPSRRSTALGEMTRDCNDNPHVYWGESLVF